jgi:hypothetical protein
MTDINQLLTVINSREIVTFLFKAFALVLSVIYLLYAIVVSKQTEIMNRTLESKSNYILFFVASLQITLAFILIILAIFLL